MTEGAQEDMMASKYLDLMFTDAVCRAQQQYYGSAGKIVDAFERDPLGQTEAQFIAARDSFYLGSISESGWPYIQHRGGVPGFLRLLNETTLVFADYKGNRQLLSTGNISVNNRVALFLMDYRNRERLKILGRARVEDARSHSQLVTRIVDPERRSSTERLVFIDVVSFDWNCPKHITPRYSADEVEDLVGSLKERIAELEAGLTTARKLSSAG